MEEINDGYDPLKYIDDEWDDLLNQIIEDPIQMKDIISRSWKAPLPLSYELPALGIGIAFGQFAARSIASSNNIPQDLLIPFETGVSSVIAATGLGIAHAIKFFEYSYHYAEDEARKRLQSMF